MEAFHKVIAVILIGVLIFLWPIRFVARQQLEAEKSYLQRKAGEFVNYIVEQGYISLSNYELLKSELSVTGGIYDIKLVHSIPVEGLKEDPGITKSEALKEDPEIARPEVLMAGLNFSVMERTCFVCGAAIDDLEFGEDLACRQCQRTPVSILVFPEEVWVPQNGEVEISVFITYADGRLELLNEWECSIDTSTLGTGRALVSAEGLVSELVVHVEETTEEGSNDDLEQEVTEEGTGDDLEQEVTEEGSSDDFEPGVEEEGESDDASVYSYFENTYSKDIIAALYEEKKYLLQQGSYISVVVTVQSVSISGKILTMFFGGTQIGEQVARFGKRIPM